MKSAQNKPGQDAPNFGQANVPPNWADIEIDMGQARTSHNQPKTGQAKVHPNWARTITLTWARPKYTRRRRRDVDGKSLGRRWDVDGAPGDVDGTSSTTIPQIVDVCA